MISIGHTIKTSRGDSDMVGLFEALDKASVPTVGDLLYAGQRQRSRILDRTSRGVDVDEQPFTPYSQNGPYYYYPGKSSQNRGAAAGKKAKQLGIKGAVTNSQKRAGILGRTRLGIKFANYGAMKAAFGRAWVDLRGINAPHMLQAFIVRVAGFVLTVTETFIDDGGGLDQPATEIILGIYGDEAERAEGHNQGHGHLPRRHFFGASSSDKQEVPNDILVRVVFRVKKVLGQ